VVPSAWDLDLSDVKLPSGVSLIYDESGDHPAYGSRSGRQRGSNVEVMYPRQGPLPPHIMAMNLVPYNACATRQGT